MNPNPENREPHDADTGDFCRQARIYGRRGLKTANQKVDQLVDLTRKHPRAAVYGAIGFLLGGLGGIPGRAVLAVVGAVWGYRKAPEKTADERLLTDEGNNA